MNVLMLLRSELRRSAAVLAGIAAVLALSLSISIATGMTDRMLRHASAQAADRFDLLIGAKASPSSLLLGAVFLRDEPLPLVPLSVMKDLDERHGVKWAAPVAFGDRAGDSPIVGTTTSLVASGVRRQSVIENSRKRLQDVNARSRRRHAALKESVLQAQGNPGKAQTRSPEVPDRDRR